LEPIGIPSQSHRQCGENHRFLGMIAWSWPGLSPYMWNKPYFITSLLLGSNFLCGLVVGLIAVLMGAGGKSVMLPTSHLCAYAIGQVYASKQHQAMPHSLRLWSATHYCLLTYLVLLILIRSMNPSLFTFSNIHDGTLLFILVLPLISSALLYWAMGWGAKQYLKKMGIS
jgi:hypothetical protein